MIEKSEKYQQKKMVESTNLHFDVVPLHREKLFNIVTFICTRKNNKKWWKKIANRKKGHLILANWNMFRCIQRARDLKLSFEKQLDSQTCIFSIYLLMDVYAVMHICIYFVRAQCLYFSPRVHRYKCNLYLSMYCTMQYCPYTGPFHKTCNSLYQFICFASFKKCEIKNICDWSDNKSNGAKNIISQGKEVTQELYG